MKIQNTYKPFSVSMLISILLFSTVFADNGISTTPMELDESGHNLLITKEIELATINKSFKKKLSKHLNKRECEKSVFVKKAKLKVSNERLIVDFTTRITRKYCTRRAKKQLYEKTKNIQYNYVFDLSNEQFEFVETDNENKYATYNQSLTDVIGKNAKSVIAEILLKELGLGTETISQSLTLNGSLKFTSVKFDSNKLTFMLSTYK